MASALILKNKVAVITGAGGGIGRVISRALAGAGCNLVLVGRSQKNLDDISKELSFCGYRSLTAVIDVSERRQVEMLVKKIIKKYRRIDILVNAAGISVPIGPFVRNNIDKWLKNLKINLLGTIFFSRAVLPHMLKQRAGKIINFSGGGAVMPRPNFSAYAVSKAAVVKFTETLAEELNPYNIQVNAIAPGAINTKMLNEALKAGSALVGQEEYKRLVKQKEEGGDSPQLAADLVLFLASDKSYNLSGKLISAKWDNWRDWNKKEIERIMKTSEYTLRRIDNKYFYEK